MADKALARVVSYIRLTYVVVILPTQVDGVYIHASVIGPVVRKSHDQLDADFTRGVDDLVESFDIYGRLTVSPALEDHFCTSGAFTAVLRQTGRVVGNVLVVETPCAKDFETGFLGCGHA